MFEQSIKLAHEIGDKRTEVAGSEQSLHGFLSQGGETRRERARVAKIRSACGRRWMTPGVRRGRSTI